MKRLFDIVVALIVLGLTAPLLVIIAVLSALELREPPLYLSKRVGKGGRLFGLFRFRTMERIYHPTDPISTHKMTRVGAVIRNYSLDDIPNLLNVLIGDMSIVGPRPMEPERVNLADPVWQSTLSVRPGLLSFAILTLARTYNDSDPQIKQHFELDYIARQSFRFDLSVFIRWMQRYIASKGNIKARGRPQGDA
jgi:lipopolysaccharide/colanic/teichoic acid biosynthesis glycosyltransferase